ncbi:unnamed protein product [Rotaria sordida]|uniref:Uncharacterized protein n=1 Tax=Rotaria sordida TaxID=392033 RepID=A0A818ZKW3_9BILA|nr:unnamed protein product [Rotaria sordida]
MLTTFWDLCPDILLDIFRYFSIDQLFHLFYPDVLPNISDILRESRMKFQLCLTNDDLLTATLLSLVDQYQVISLCMTTIQIGLEDFLNIQSITLLDVYIDTILSTQLSILPLLKCITLIYSHNESQLSQESLTYICRLPFLKYLELDFRGGYLNIPQISHEHTCSIEELVLRTPCSWKKLQGFIVHLFHLRILRVMINVNEDQNINNRHYLQYIPPIVSNVNFPSIEIFDLTWYTIEMKDILVFIRSMPNLQKLNLSGITNEKTLQSHIWQELLKVVCPNLKRLNVKMLIWIQEGAEEIKDNFDRDLFFKQTHFYLIPSKHERELLQFKCEFRR